MTPSLAKWKQLAASVIEPGAAMVRDYRLRALHKEVTAEALLAFLEAHEQLVEENARLSKQNLRLLDRNQRLTGERDQSVSLASFTETMAQRDAAETSLAALREKVEALSAKMHRAFHGLWTASVGAPQYHKSAWMELDGLIANLQPSALGRVNSETCVACGGSGRSFRASDPRGNDIAFSRTALKAVIQKVFPPPPK